MYTLEMSLIIENKIICSMHYAMCYICVCTDKSIYMCMLLTHIEQKKY